MARFSEEEIGEAISFATAKLGYQNLRSKQDLAVRHFLARTQRVCCTSYGKWQTSVLLSSS